MSHYNIVLALACQLRVQKAQARRKRALTCAVPLLAVAPKREKKKKLDVEAGRKKLNLSACSPCRRLGAEGTQMSMSGPGSRPAEGAGAAGARPGGACRRPFLRRVELREEREEENEDILPVVFRSLNAPSFPRHLWPRGKNASSSRPRRRRLPCAGVLFTSIFLLFLP